jgi:hypothetical protein
MPGLVPGIHAAVRFIATWMAGTSPAMTVLALFGDLFVLRELPDEIHPLLAEGSSRYLCLA